MTFTKKPKDPVHGPKAIHILEVLPITLRQYSAGAVKPRPGYIRAYRDRVGGYSHLCKWNHGGVGYDEIALPAPNHASRRSVGRLRVEILKDHPAFRR